MCPAWLIHVTLHSNEHSPPNVSLKTFCSVILCLHNTAIKKLTEAALLSLQAELSYHPAKQAAAQIAHILATKGIPIFAMEENNSLLHKVSQVSCLSSAHLGHPFLPTTGYTQGNLSICITLGKNVILPLSVMDS